MLDIDYVGFISEHAKVGDIIAEVWNGETTHYLISQQIIPNGVYEGDYIISEEYILVNLTQATVTDIKSNTVKGLFDELLKTSYGLEVENIYMTKLSSVTIDIEESTMED